MFQALITQRMYHYTIIDSDFTAIVDHPNLYIGNSQYKLRHNGKLMFSVPWRTLRALAVVLEYQKRNLPIALNLVRYYIWLVEDQNLTEDDLPEEIDFAKDWFKRCCPETNFPVQCIQHQITKNQWVYNKNRR